MFWTKKKPGPHDWKTMCDGRFFSEQDVAGFDALWFTLGNVTDRPIDLPKATVALSYTTFAGGSPAQGGNGVDSLLLDLTPNFPATISAGKSITIPIETTQARILTLPKRVTRSRHMDDDAFEKHRASLESAYAKVASALANAPSLVAFVRSDAAFWVDLKFDGQFNHWFFSG